MSIGNVEQVMTMAVDARCRLGEGLVWDPKRQALLWTDIEEARLWMWWPDGSTRTWRLPDRAGALGICTSGRLLIGLAKALVVTNPEAASGEHVDVTELTTIEPDIPTTRINDGRADRHGNFVFGTYNEAPDGARLGSFYQYSFRHGLRRLALGHVTISNGICFSHDGHTMYFCDSPTRRIMRCRYDADTAGVSDVQDFVRFGPGDATPDGSTIDADGALWNAVWGAGCVRRYLPDGTLDRVIRVPVRHVTCPAFAGFGFGDLYVTTAHTALSAVERASAPSAGGVFVAERGGMGLPESLIDDSGWR